MKIRTLLAVLAASAVGAGVVAVVPAQAAGTTPYAFTISASTRTVTLGGTTKLSGTVRPSAVGSALVVQQRSGTAWTKLRTIQTQTGSTFATSVRPTAAGTATYRVCKAGAGAYKTTCSAPVGIGVYRWHYLTDQDYVDSSGMGSDSVTLSINGTTYTKSFYNGYAGGTDYREWNVSRKCSTLVGTFGLHDNSKTGTSSQIELLADGNSLYQKTFGLGSSEKRTINIGNYLRIRFEMTGLKGPSSSSLGMGAVGSPKILCRF